MTIDFIEEEKDGNPRIIPSIKFESVGRFYEATLYLDDIPVAFFDNETGGLRLIPLEVGDYYQNGGDLDLVTQLEDKGVIFDKTQHSRVGDTAYEYHIKVRK